ncbi:hypothetical protein ACQ4M4_00215 [Leptolyngbya sp. AN02str]
MVAIFEKEELIDQLRATNRKINVFAHTSLAKSVRELNAESVVKLTGVVGDGLAQIKEPVVGWVQSTHLKAASSGMQKGQRYRLRNTPELSQGLAAYHVPGSPQNDGPAANSFVFVTNPADSYLENGRRYIRVYYTGVNGNERVGYVSQGPVGSVLGQASSNFSLA